MPRTLAAVRRTILVVEDDALIASYIQDVLEQSGFAVAGMASSGPEALSVAHIDLPVLALVDIRLAGVMDGVEVANILRSQLDVPSIFLSGIDDQVTIERARLAQPLGFLRKPFCPGQVFNAIEHALRQIARVRPPHGSVANALPTD